MSHHQTICKLLALYFTWMLSVVMHYSPGNGFWVAPKSFENGTSESKHPLWLDLSHGRSLVLCIVTCSGLKFFYIRYNLAMLLMQVVNRGCIRGVSTALRRSLRVYSQDSRKSVAYSGTHTMGESDLSTEGSSCFLWLLLPGLKLHSNNF